MSQVLLTQLKTLNLGGVLESLEVRVAQANASQLSYEEFLALVVQDEIERREARKLQRRLRQATFEEQKTIEGFDFGFNPGVPGKKVRELAAGMWLVRHENVLVCGHPGVGKTHLAQALGHQACRQGKTARFTKASALFRDLAAARSDHTWEATIRAYTKPDVLIIDDFGLKGLSQAQADDIAEIVSERYLRGGMVFTSNRRVEEWQALFPDPVFANSVLDRLAHNAHQLIIEGESYRKKKRPEAQ